ncbi:nucleotidyltransferase domain-containing protein [Azospirillum sp. sgz301742]
MTSLPFSPDTGAAGPDATVDLLLASARRTPDEAGARSAVERGVDWDRFIEMAVGHRIVLPVHRAMNALPLPEIARTHIGAAARRASLRALAATTEATRTVRALEGAGVPALLVKGPVEAVASWGNPAGREASDVDLYVQPSDAPRAARVLEGLGLRPMTPAAAPFLGSGWLQLAELAFVAPARGTMIDLHWEFTSPRMLFPVAVAQAMTGSVTVDLAGTPVRTLPDAETFLYLCVHGSSHGWSRLSWLCDVAERLRSGRDGGSRTTVLAQQWDLVRPLAVGCRLAAGLLNAPLPEWCPPPDRTVRRLAALWAGGLIGLPDADALAGRRPTSAKLPTDLALLTRPAGKAALLAALLRPREADVEEAPGASMPAILLRRFIRLFRHGQRRHRR